MTKAKQTAYKLSIAVGDRMFLEMQDFDFAQIQPLLLKFRLNLTQIFLTFTKILPKSN